MDFRGWNSSYTGEPIPLEEMVEWRSATVDRIMALQPRRVLEIGAGSGLLLSQIAPQCEHYVATDMSAAVVDDLDRSLEQLQVPWRDRVELLARARPRHRGAAAGLLRHHHPQLGRPVLPQRADIWPRSSTTPWICWPPAGHCSSATSATTACRARFKPRSRWRAPARRRRRRDPPTSPARHARRTRITVGPRVLHHLGRRPRVRWPDSTSKSNAGWPTTNSPGTATTSPSTKLPHRCARLAGAAHLGVGPVRGPARAAHPVAVPTSRHRPHHRHSPRRSDHRRRHRTGPGRRATLGRGSWPKPASQPMPLSPKNCTASVKPPDTTSRSPGVPNPAPWMPFSFRPPTPTASTPRR